MKAREFVRDYLTPAGAVLHKKDGDHHIYKLPNGRYFHVPMGGTRSEIDKDWVKRLHKRLSEP